MALGSLRMTQPAAFILSTISRLPGFANQSMIAITSVGPMPSTSASSLGVAYARASMSPNAAATSGATPLPMCRIDNATKNLSNGRVFAASRLASSFTPFVERAPDFVEEVGLFQLVLGQAEQITPSMSRPASSKACVDW